MMPIVTTFATDRRAHTKLRLGCRHSFGHEQLPVISYFSHDTSMRDQQVLYAKQPNWAAYKTP
jgi:hypothetical protein